MRGDWPGAPRAARAAAMKAATVPGAPRAARAATMKAATVLGAPRVAHAAADAPAAHTARAAGGLLGLVFAIGLGGCAEEASEAGGEWRAERETVGDTVVVRTVAGSVWGEPAELVPELRIGSLSGDDEYLLGDVTGLAVDEAGRIYVYDQQVPALRQYAPDGRYLRTFGRAGAGPGEYRQADLGALAVLPDGRVLLRDPGNARINVYASDGTPLDTWPLAGGRFVSTPLVVDTAGRVYTRVFGSVDGMAVYAPDGERRDTLPAPSWEIQTATVSAQVPGARQMWNVPFTTSRRWAFSPHGYYAGGPNDRYSIDLLRPQGEVVRIQRQVEPVPVSAGERRAEEHRVTSAMRRLQPDWSWNGPRIPDTKPAFRDLFVGRDGRLWVLLHSPGQEATEAAGETASGDAAAPVPWTEPVRFDVFEPDGTYLGEVRAPDGFRVNPTPTFDGDQVWAVMTDDLGVQYVTRFRIARG